MKRESFGELAAKFLIGSNAACNNDRLWRIVAKSKLSLIDECFDSNALETSGKVCTLNVI
ncbi:hypothetical protein D3C72_2587710 [compost metagenome]